MVSKRSGPPWAQIFLGFLFMGALLEPGLAFSRERPTPVEKIIFGEVSALEGEAAVEGQPLRLGSIVYQGDTIKVGRGRVQIKSGRSVFMLSSFSQIKLGPPLSTTSSFIDLIEGTIKCMINWVLYRTKVPTNSFHLRTLTVVTGVRGTEFVMHASPKAALIFTQEGNVSFSSSGRTISLGPMLMSQGGENVTPLDPESVLSNKLLADLLKEVESFCDLRVPEGLTAPEDRNNVIARFNLNYASYLVEKKEFEKAKKLCALAFLFADLEDIRAEALVNRATISFRFMGEEEAAIKDLEEVLANFKDTPYQEHALFYLGLIYYQRKNEGGAKKALEQYLERFPEGRFRENALSILQKLPGQ